MNRITITLDIQALTYSISIILLGGNEVCLLLHHDIAFETIEKYRQSGEYEMTYVYSCPHVSFVFVPKLAQKYDVFDCSAT
ncbi:hypothetical protein [Parapedobacter lycopersici]|uniref:hypothetical protein n=1 Tax=Parapedobacter lycopersici TaxID=1864939 RepID=UPI003341ED71